ncbi:MAG TPA: regulator [Pseudolysinimonas sp.]|jgi:MinD-like ATPase involved in chromosome partitioning or flagellar assembly|nr:regulator [Pseudolysinimonas sp.]
MTTFALAVPFDDEQRLVADAGRYGHSVAGRFSGADELASRLPALAPQAVLAAADPQYLNARLVAACDASAARLVVVADSPDQQRYARSLGVVDALVGELAWATLMPNAAPPAPAVAAPEGDGVAPAPRAARRGTVVTVWGPSGAPGRTSLAIAIAAELADAGVTVALADADTHAAAIDPALGLLDEAPGFAAACRLAGTGALTNAEFERIAEWHASGASGFWVLTGLGRPARWPELSEQRIAGVIEAARSWVDVLLIDTASSIEQDEELVSDLAAPRRNAAALAALRGADHVIAVAAADPIGLTRFLRAHAELVEVVAPPRVTTIANKVRATAIGMNPQAQVAQTLSRFGGISEPVAVPWDPAAFDAAVLGGKTLRDAAPRSPARLAVRRFVLDRLAPAPAVPVPRRARRREPSN